MRFYNESTAKLKLTNVFYLSLVVALFSFALLLSVHMQKTTTANADVAPSIEVKRVSALNGDKVDVCHHGRLMSVSMKALPSHLAHGDILGSCDIQPPPQQALAFNDGLKLH